MSGNSMKPMSASSVATRERVAAARVVVAELAEQVDARRDRDDEVQRAVEVVRGDDERLEVQRPVLERLLVVDAEHALPADEVLRRCGTRASAPALLAFRTAEYTK